ncbi:MAG: hypothetical protein HC795_08410 [Coleofasciculaceae cyanobacterium RL_1_1]|nr:hypothetical protein [Coleofasciculaceae cyanobacterium RL_1_1]
MISESSFQNRSLSQALYETAIERVKDSLSSTVGREFTQCQFGIVPGPDGQRMLFVITESCSQVEQLSAYMEEISGEVVRLMPGVARIALCVCPIGGRECDSVAPRRVVGRIFELTSDDV